MNLNSISDRKSKETNSNKDLKTNENSEQYQIV